MNNLRVIPTEEVRRLLQERFASLNSANAMLRRQFHAQRARLEESMGVLRKDPALRASVSRTELQGLADFVAVQLEEAQHATRRLAMINSGLQRIGRGGFSPERGHGVDDAVFGLPWMLSYELLEAWSSMWQADRWIGIYAALSPAEFERKLCLHNNVHESLLLQQGERRVRETVLEMRELPTDVRSAQSEHPG